MISPGQIAALTDETVLAETRRLALCEQAAGAALVAMLAELDSRKLFHAAGYNSLFSFCTDELHLSEDAAYTRIEVARVSRLFPLLLVYVEDGSLSLTNARLLAPLLTPDNHVEILRSAQHRRKRDVERLIATLRAQPDAESVLRKLPARAPLAPQLLPDPAAEGAAATNQQLESQTISVLNMPVAAPPAGRPVVAPLSSERFKVQFTADRETHDLLRRAQALARNKTPNGDLAIIFKLALQSFVASLERTEAGVVAKPRQSKPPRRGSRHIPRNVRRAVWTRDNAQCAYEGPRGRCPETDFLEFHHLRPFAHGGASTVDNLELRCRSHNVLEHHAMLD